MARQAVYFITNPADDTIRVHAIVGAEDTTPLAEYDATYKAQLENDPAQDQNVSLFRLDAEVLHTY